MTDSYWLSASHCSKTWRTTLDSRRSYARRICRSTSSTSSRRG